MKNHEASHLENNYDECLDLSLFNYFLQDNNYIKFLVEQ